MDLKYVVKRLEHMNYKKMLDMVSLVSKKTKKPGIIIFFDMVYCGIKYQCGYIDYNLFEMYDLNSKQRKTVVTRGRNNAYIKAFNNFDYAHIFLNKPEFNLKFNKYLKRDWLLLDGYNFDKFVRFIQNKEAIIVKPVSGTCGKGIEKISLKDHDLKELYNYLMNNKLLLIEELIIQNDIMTNLYAGAVNTVRMITLSKNGKTAILAAYLRIGNGGRVVDNFNSGGMVAPINIEKGIIEYPALDKAGTLYEKHPITNTIIKGFKIPRWDEVIKLAKEVAPMVPEMGMIGWDISVSVKGPLLVEGNEYPGHDIYQLPPHRTDGIGMLPQFERTLKELGIKKRY